MFRFSTIAVALLLVLSGMKITIASHYCQGTLAKTIISLNGKTASCGMVHTGPTESETKISAKCCDDELHVYTVGDDYAPSDIRFGHLFNFDYFSPEIIASLSVLTALTKQIDYSPPGHLLTSAVHAAEICVFRI